MLIPRHSRKKKRKKTRLSELYLHWSLRRNAKRSSSNSALFTGYSTQETSSPLRTRDYCTFLLSDQSGPMQLLFGEALSTQHRGSSKNSDPNPTQNYGCTLVHPEFRVETAKQIIGKLATSYEELLHRHPNTLAILLLKAPPISRLKKKDTCSAQLSRHHNMINIVSGRLRKTRIPINLNVKNACVCPRAVLA